MNTYHVTIKDGLGHIENPWKNHKKDNTKYNEFYHANPPLPIYDQQGNQILDGVFECERVFNELMTKDYYKIGMKNIGSLKQIKQRPIHMNIQNHMGMKPGRRIVSLK